jgi:hypothetical protein
VIQLTCGARPLGLRMKTGVSIPVGGQDIVYKEPMKKSARFAAATAMLVAGLGLAGLGTATEAQAQPGPFPNWCPGEFWDPGWGPNWDWGGCHDWHRDWGPGPGFRPGDPGHPGWDRR